MVLHIKYRRDRFIRFRNPSNDLSRSVHDLRFHIREMITESFYEQLSYYMVKTTDLSTAKNVIFTGFSGTFMHYNILKK